MIKFTASNFKGDCNIDPDFAPMLSKMNAIAAHHNIHVIVISSYRIDANVKGAIVTPATHSNHMIGHAIDCNIEHDGGYYNSKLMQTDTGVVHQFIQECKEAGFRWGGDFGTKDPVHFDDGLNVNNLVAWTEKYNKLHRTTA